MFLIFPRFVSKSEFGNVEQIAIENIDIPQTQQIDNTPPPAQEKKVAQDLFKKRKKAQPKQQSKQQKESTIEEEADVDTHDV